MKKHILQIIIGVVCLATAAVSAQKAERSYAPMLVDGRVWEYIWDFGTGAQDITPDRYRLNGTVERFGKTYHVLLQGKNDTVALLREENGKVWRLADVEGKIDSPYNKAGEIPKGMTATASTEFLLYDMGLEKNDSIMLVSRCQEDFDEQTPYIATIMSVNDVSTTQGTEGELKELDACLTVAPSWRKFRIVEGVGNVYHELFHEFNLGHFKYCIPTYPNLNRLFNPDGSVYFYGMDYGRMLIEGRKWEYRHTGSFGNQNYIETMTLQGDSAVNGVRYKVLRSDLGGKCLLRESNNRVFRYNREDGSETLLYDFNIMVGEKYEYAGETGAQATISVKRFAWEFYNRDRIRLVQDLEVTNGDSASDTFYVIWPLGIVNYGTLADFQTGPWPTNGLGGTSLMRVTNPGGTVLYYNESLDLAGVESVADEGRATDSRKYDLSGREIRNPEPGAVYIQGGRKHVAPRR